MLNSWLGFPKLQKNTKIVFPALLYIKCLIFYLFIYFFFAFFLLDSLEFCGGSKSSKVSLSTVPLRLPHKKCLSSSQEIRDSLILMPDAESGLELKNE